VPTRVVIFAVATDNVFVTLALLSVVFPETYRVPETLAVAILAVVANKVVMLPVVILPVVTANVMMLPVVILPVVIVPVVIVAVVICATFAVSVFVTLALLNVVLPVTDNVFAKVPEPATERSSNPTVSKVILPDTVKSPVIVVLPTTESVLPTIRLVLA